MRRCLLAAGAQAAEREVVWYTAMNVPDAEALRKPFQEKHPSLALIVVRATGEKLRTRILTEARAKRFLWDVVSFNLLDMDALNQEGLLAAYVSPETASGYAPGAVDRAGRWAAIYVRQYVIGYNTKLVPRGEAPRSWQDLLAPQWAGKLALDESDVEWYAAMLDYWGRDAGLRFMRALGGQSPQLRRGHTLLSRLLVAGDFPLALVHAAEIEQEKARGAPVDWVRGLDPVITSASQIAVSAHAPHPQAARRFVDFVLSPQGQTLIRARGRVPARTDLAAATAAEPLRVHYVKPELARDFQRHEQGFREAFARLR
jgi:iron(III) transport system substrate-binding protein